MAIVKESMRGNSKIYICDDMYANINQEEREERKRKIREAMGRIAASPGAAERFSAYKEREGLESTKPLHIC